MGMNLKELRESRSGSGTSSPSCEQCYPRFSPRQVTLDPHIFTVEENGVVRYMTVTEDGRMVPIEDTSWGD